MESKGLIFISYSHADNEWLDRLMPFLRALKHQARVRAWSDKDIQLSADWHAEIQKALNEADAAILLISQDFLASEYIRNNELPKLLSAASERGLRIFPVFVSSCYGTSPLLLRFQAINTPAMPLDLISKAEQNQKLASLAKKIDELLEFDLAGVSDEWVAKFQSRFVPVVGGAYVMGDNELYSQIHALPEHEAHVDSFRLGQYVIRQSEWIALIKTQPWVGLDKKNVHYGDDNPVVYVSWFDAVDFARAISRRDPLFNYRLPMEAEWEYAARGGQETLHKSGTKFSFGDDLNKLIEYGWYIESDSPGVDTYAHPVGMLKPNQLNLFDMHGNIWEWTSEGSNDGRILRGGGFNASALAASSAYRVLAKPEMTGPAAGFRLVQEPK